MLKGKAHKKCSNNSRKAWSSLCDAYYSWALGLPWFIYPVALNWRKLVSLCQQLSIANSFFVHLLSQSWDPDWLESLQILCSGGTLCEFLHIWETLFPCTHPPPLARTVFLPPLPHGSLHLEGLMKAPSLVLTASKSLTFCTLCSCGSLLFLSTAARSFSGEDWTRYCLWMQ